MPRLPLRPALALAAAAVVATPAAAQSSLSLYGLIDLSVGATQAPGANSVKGVDSGRMTTSYLGFSGVEDLGDGLKARFGIESFLRADTGAGGRFDTDTLWARRANVGLEKTGLGSVYVGRNTTPLFVTTLAYNPFGDSFGFSPSIRHWFVGGLYGDSGWNNSTAVSATLAPGLSATFVGNFGEGAASAVGRNTSWSVRYAQGAFSGTLTTQSVKNGAVGTPAGFAGQSAVQLGMSYDLKVAKLFGQFGKMKTNANQDVDTTLFQLGTSVPVGAGAFLASYGQSKAEAATDTTRKATTVGYDQYLSKRTDVYGVLMKESRTALAGGTSWAVGMRHRF